VVSGVREQFRTAATRKLIKKFDKVYPSLSAVLSGAVDPFAQATPRNSGRRPHPPRERSASNNSNNSNNSSAKSSKSSTPVDTPAGTPAATPKDTPHNTPKVTGAKVPRPALSVIPDSPRHI
jgi:hypothetical protein